MGEEHRHVYESLMTGWPGREGDDVSFDVREVIVRYAIGFFF